MEYFKLANGALMPAIGFGTVNVAREGGRLENPLTDDFSAVTTALQAGYRLFDTALAYGNEAGIGQAVEKSGIKREELFLSGKVPNKAPYNVSKDSVRRSVEESLLRMRIEYFDLMLIHHAASPDNGVMDEDTVCMIWETLCSLKKEGKLLGVGVSNFDARQLSFLLDNCSEKPLVDQLRCNPACPNSEAIRLCKQNGILPEAHSPLNFTKARGIKIVDPTYMQKLTLLGQRHKKSWSQILLRYNYQNGLVSIPGSSKPEHQTANLDIFDFELSELEMEEITFKD